VRQPPQGAQEQPEGGALLVDRVDDLDDLAIGRGVWARDEVGARPDHLVVAGEVAGDDVARRGEARGAPIEAAEQKLHELARDLRREYALGGCVKCPDVERPRVP
jgi:hypothetical protein